MSVAGNIFMSLQVEETLSTLSYATRAKNIHNRPTVQYDPREAQISLLRREIELLRQENGLLREQLRAGGAASGAQACRCALCMTNDVCLHRLQLDLLRCLSWHCASTTRMSCSLLCAMGWRQLMCGLVLQVQRTTACQLRQKRHNWLEGHQVGRVTCMIVLNGCACLHN